MTSDGSASGISIFVKYVTLAKNTIKIHITILFNLEAMTWYHKRWNFRGFD